MDDSYLDVYNLHGFKVEHENMEPNKLLSEACSIQGKCDAVLTGARLGKNSLLAGSCLAEGIN